MIHQISYITSIKRWCCIALVSFFATGQLYANIIILDLDGSSNCNGQLSVELYLKVSNNSELDHFGIGSSSIFLNYNPDTISFASYQPAEFNYSTSAQAKQAEWVNQSKKVNDANGIINLVLHKDVGGFNDYVLNKSIWTHIGTLTFNWVGAETDPGITLNKSLTYFNTPINDGLEERELENYPTLNDWNNCNTYCQTDGPVVSGVTTSNVSCGTLVNDGSITISFPNKADRTGIEFSLNGGVTYPYFSNDNAGSITIPNLFGGKYELFCRWENEDCPTEIGEYDLNPSPVIERIWSRNSCENYNIGRIFFAFSDFAGRTNIEFSINGGASYPYSTADNVGTYKIQNLPAGTYDLWVRWGSGDCAIDLPDQTINNNADVPVTATHKDACNNNGQIILTFSDTPERSAIEFSIDGGVNYPYHLADNIGQFVIDDLGIGTYDVWARWGNDQCPEFVKTVTIAQITLPEATATLSSVSCDNEPNGSILTFAFPDKSGRSQIEFSVDGGVTYPFNTLDNVGSIDVPIAAGTHDLWVRWGNNDCPVDLPDVTVTQLVAPIISNISTYDDCSGSGSLVFSFPNVAGRGNLEFSINGGATYPHKTPDNVGTYTIPNLAPGTYDLWVRWGDNACPVDLPDQTIQTGGTLDVDGFEGTSSFWSNSDMFYSYLYTNSYYAVSGTKCWLLRGNYGDQSSLKSITTDFTGYSELEVLFDYKVLFQNTGNKLFLEVSTNEGATYQTVGELQYGTDFFNNQTVVYNASITIDNIAFNKKTKLRIRAATSKYGYFFLDNIVVKGCGGSGQLIKSNTAASNSKLDYFAIPDEDLSAESIHIYPNPASKSDQLFIEVKLEDIVGFSIFDTNGRLVKREETSESNYTIDTQDFNSGTYLLQVETTTGSKVRKFVVLE